MSNEIELKFEVDKQAIPQLTAYFNQCNIIATSHLQLSNRYYDTKDNFLRKSRSSVRIRGTTEKNKPTQYEITVKSAGNVVAGLHQRSEVNVDLPNSELNLAVLPTNTLPADIEITALQNALTVLFTTDFNRQVWFVNYKTSEIEIALDQGLIVCESNPLTLPIQEIELELKSGSKMDLIEFAMELSRFNLHLFSQSKAARGYRLYQHTALNKQSELIISGSITEQISQLLSYWQTNEEYALAVNDFALYQETIHQIQSFFALGSFSELERDKSAWMDASNKITNVTDFAFSPINTQLKLGLIRFLINNLCN